MVNRLIHQQQIVRRQFIQNNIDLACIQAKITSISVNDDFHLFLFFLYISACFERKSIISPVPRVTGRDGRDPFKNEKL